MRDREISFVWFDVGNVIWDLNRRFESLAETIGVNPKTLKAAFFKHDRQACIGDISPEEFYHKVLDDLKIPKSPIPSFKEYWKQGREPITPVFALIEELAINKVPIGLITDIFSGMLGGDCNIDRTQLPIANYVAILRSSDSQIRAQKRDGGVFPIATGVSTVPEKENLLIDDNRDNVMVAASHGWKTFLFDPKTPEKSVHHLRTKLLVPAGLLQN